MCIDGNNAHHSIHYINAQLAALHAIASQCVDQHVLSGVSISDGQNYDTALAEFNYHAGKNARSEGDLLFSASFGTPTLGFICNHDALFDITITAGKYHPDHNIVKTLGAAGKPNGRREVFKPVISSASYVRLSNEKISVRVPFKTVTIHGQSTTIANGHHDIKLITLDFANAQFIEQSFDITDTLAFYLRAYLDFLRRAGHHTIYSLPDFDNDGLSRKIDYSEVATVVYSDVTDVHGIDLAEINKYVSNAWLRACWIAVSEAQITNHADVSIAEYKSDWSLSLGGGPQFHAKFGAPRIEALCEREVVLYFCVDEILFSPDKSFTGSTTRFKNWEIAVIVDVDLITEENGSILTVKINSSTRAKWAQILSRFTDLPEDNSVLVDYFMTFVDFLTFEYLQILDTANYLVLFRRDYRVIIDVGEPGSGSGTWAEGSGSSEREWYHELTSTSQMFGFEQIITLSQASIDAHFASLMSIPSFSWISSHRESDFFSAKYGPLTVRLLSDERALVWVEIKSGALKTLYEGKPSRESEQHQISNWRLCWEVAIVVRDESDINLDGFTAEEQAVIENAPSHAHRRRKGYKYRNVCLDFNDKNMQFKYEQSVFDDSTFRRSRLAIDKVRAAIKYIEQYYFGKLIARRCDIIYSIPIWVGPKGKEDPYYAFTSVAFHVYSRKPVNVHNYHRLQFNEQPVIVILGMCTNNPLPSGRLQFSSSWLMRVLERVSFGTLALSSSLFLDGRLLRVLADLNRHTTIVPSKIDIDAGVWDIFLVTWDQHEKKTLRDPVWEPVVKPTGNALEYNWDHSDDWTYRHEGSMHETSNGSYYLNLKTDNHLVIPTVFRQGQLDITMRGKTSVSLGLKTEGKSFDSTASVTWAVTISAVTDNNGLRIQVTSQTVPVFTKSNVDADFVSGVGLSKFKDPLTLLKSHFPVPTFDKILEDLKAFEGMWETCFPGLHTYRLGSANFTTRGDVLMELLPGNGIVLVGNRPDIGGRIASVSGKPRFDRTVSTKIRSASSPAPPKTIGSNGLNGTKIGPTGLGNGFPSSNGNGAVKSISKPGAQPLVENQDQPTVKVRVESEDEGDRDRDSDSDSDSDPLAREGFELSV